METEYYNAQFAHEDSHWWYAGRRRILDALLGTFAPGTARRVLEIGCGGGGNFAMLGARGDALEAVEMETSAVETARQRGLATVSLGRLGDALDAFQQQHEIVAMFDVLEHIADDAAALRAVRELLTEDGRLFLTVPAYGWLWSRHDEVAHHHRRYTRRALRQRLEQAGYRTVFCSHFNTLLFPLAVLTLTMTKLLRLDPERAMTQPSGPLNAALRWLFSLEAHLVPRCALPFGLSIVAVAEPIKAARHPHATA